jgi:hypothetical protein
MELTDVTDKYGLMMFKNKVLSKTHEPVREDAKK